MQLECQSTVVPSGFATRWRSSSKKLYPYVLKIFFSRQYTHHLFAIRGKIRKESVSNEREERRSECGATRGTITTLYCSIR